MIGGQLKKEMNDEIKILFVGSKLEETKLFYDIKVVLFENVFFKIKIVNRFAIKLHMYLNVLSLML